MYCVASLLRREDLIFLRMEELLHLRAHSSSRARACPLGVHPLHWGLQQRYSAVLGDICAAVVDSFGRVLETENL
jgi:hypothetical protein